MKQGIQNSGTIFEKTMLIAASLQIADQRIHKTDKERKTAMCQCTRKTASSLYKRQSAKEHANAKLLSWTEFDRKGTQSCSPAQGCRLRRGRRQSPHGSGWGTSPAPAERIGKQNRMHREERVSRAALAGVLGERVLEAAQSQSDMIDLQGGRSQGERQLQRHRCMCSGCNSTGSALCTLPLHLRLPLALPLPACSHTS